MITLKNQYLTVLVNELGAELTSVKDKDNTEYIWQANPDFWNRHAPILFPIVGRLTDNQYLYQGKTYQMTQHGFARDNQFRVGEQSDTMVKLSLTQTEETLVKYPFNFNLGVRFELVDHELRVQYTVQNPATKDLLFSIGAHPGLNVPLIPDQNTFEESYVKVAPQKVYRQIPLKPPYSDPEDPRELDLKHPLMLDHELFNSDALVLDLQGQETTVLVGNTQNDRGIALTLRDAPYVGIWSPYPKQAPFVCVEPWWGLADTVTADGQLEDKFAINKLAANQKFDANYQISFF